MATAAIGRAEIEKVVRRVLDEQRQDDDGATLKAIRRVSSLLTEQVIPNLPDTDDADSDAGSEDEHDSDPAASRVFGSSALGNGEATHSDGEESEDDGQEAELPEPVLEAFETLYQTLSPNQASSLATFFTTVGRELAESGGDNEEEGEDMDEDTEANTEAEEPYRSH